MQSAFHNDASAASRSRVNDRSESPTAPAAAAAALSVTIAILLAVSVASAPCRRGARRRAGRAAGREGARDQYVQGRGCAMPAALHPDREIRVPGLSSDSPLVLCNAAAGASDYRHGSCERRGIDNGGTVQRSVRSAPDLFSDRRHRRHRSARGTIGSAAWARTPWTSASRMRSTRVNCRATGAMVFWQFELTHRAKTAAGVWHRGFRLDEALLQRPWPVARGALEDSDDVRAYRARYQEAPATSPPQVTQCDTATSDTWWTGVRLGEHATLDRTAHRRRGHLLHHAGGGQRHADSADTRRAVRAHRF